MSTDASLAEEIQKLRAEIAEVREEGKQREPNVVGALRTLVSDWNQWQRGEREVPRAAIIGLAAAYLRPRIVLVLGSVAAVAIAILQLMLLRTQNDLLAAQNEWISRQTQLFEGQGEMFEEQSRTLRADVVDKLLENLADGDDDVSLRTSLAVYGDVAFGALIPLVTQFDEAPGAWLNVRIEVVRRNAIDLVTRNARRMSNSQATSVLFSLLGELRAKMNRLRRRYIDDGEVAKDKARADELAADVGFLSTQIETLLRVRGFSRSQAGLWEKSDAARFVTRARETYTYGRLLRPCSTKRCET